MKEPFLFSSLALFTFVCSTVEGAFYEIPSESIRGAMKAAFRDQDMAEVSVMQHELNWGAAEIQRYKNLRGQWPVRSTPNINDTTRNESGIYYPLDSADSQIAPQSDYWDYLVSMF